VPSRGYGAWVGSFPLAPGLSAKRGIWRGWPLQKKLSFGARGPELRLRRLQIHLLSLGADLAPGMRPSGAIAMPPLRLDQSGRAAVCGESAAI